MTPARAPLGWGAFLAAAVVAALLGPGAQFGFAALAVAVLGLPHGASDLAIVAPERRWSFLAAYGTTIGAVVLVWLTAPTLGLFALLACSGVHFALDDEDQGVFGWARGASLVAASAILHPAALAALFDGMTRDPVAAGAFVATLQVVGLIAVGIVLFGTVLFGTVRRAAHDRRPIVTIVALAALVALPPLVGFAVGFVMLHAARQTQERRRALGCATMAAYLGRIAPVLGGAAVVLIGVAVLFVSRPAGGVGLLFAGIAALAMPHMLVTPFWHRDAATARVTTGGRAVRL